MCVYMCVWGGGDVGVCVCVCCAFCIYDSIYLELGVFYRAIHVKYFYKLSVVQPLHKMMKNRECNISHYMLDQHYK